MQSAWKRARAPRASAAGLALAALCAWVVGCDRGPPPGVRVVRVAAAADLDGAFRELARDVERETGARVELTFGSSGLLAKQVAEGAPFDVFASANVAYAEAAARSGACDDATRAPYARGRLALACPAGVPADGLAGLPRLGRLALANPEHAPYGRAAVEALESLGLAARVKAQLVFAGNVGESWQFARSGNADCAFVSKALVRDEPPSRVLDVPAALHAPIVQALVLCSGGARPGDRAAAAAFAAHVRGPHGQQVLAAYGFSPP